MDLASADLSNVWTQRLAYCAVYLWSAICFTCQGADPDLWGHVQYGRDFFKHGLEFTTTYSFTTKDYAWINHENLSEILMALGADTVGAAGLVVAKCLMGLLVVSLVLLRGRQVRARTPSVVATCVLLSVSLLTGWTMRPQLMTYTLFALMIWLLTWCFEDWEAKWGISFEDRSESESNDHDVELELPGVGTSFEGAPAWSDRWHWLWLLLPIFVVWTNSHGGFVAGIAVALAYLGLRSVQLLWQHKGRASRSVCYLALIMVATMAVTLINPYGVGLHRWLIGSLGIPRPEIVEWTALNFETPKGMIFALVLLSILGAARLSERKLDIPHTMILLLIGIQAVRQHRHVPFFAIIFAFWLLPHIDAFLFGTGAKRQRRGLSENTSFYASLALGILCFTLCFRLGPQLTRIAVPKSRYPVDAFKFMETNGINKGKIVTTYGWAQYLIGAFGTRGTERDGLLVGFDGRFRTCYPQKLLDAYLDLELGESQARYRHPDSPSVDGRRALDIGRPDLVLAMRTQTPAIRTMIEAGKSGEWVPLYQDKIAQLWGRAYIYDDSDRETYVRPEKRRLTEYGSTAVVPWPAFPDGSRSRFRFLSN